MLKDVSVIMVDEEEELILIYKGGHYINIFNPEGELKYCYWHNGKKNKNYLTIEEAKETMRERIKNKDYEDFLV
jgi:hypothetical protein